MNQLWSGTNQQRSLFAVALLAPGFRLIPRLTANIAGNACWLSSLFSIPFILFDLYVLGGLLKSCPENEGLGEMIARALGDKAGRLINGLLALWMLLYCGFLLRSGADRFLSTVYSKSTPWIFCIIMLIIASVASFGGEKILLRLSKLLLPIMVIPLAFVLVLSLSNVKLDLIFPVKITEVKKIVNGSYPTTDIVCTVMTCISFTAGLSPSKNNCISRSFLLSLVTCLFFSLLCVIAVGSFGEIITSEMSYPFFALVRNASAIGSIERIESVIVALWVFPDFALESLLIITASKLLWSSLGYVHTKSKKLLSLKSREFIIIICIIIVGMISVCTTVDSLTLQKISDNIVPFVNISVVLGVIPVCYTIGKLKRTI